MADEPEFPPVINPGQREGAGAALDLLDPKDIGLIRQAIRRGWIKSLARMDGLVEQAVGAIHAVRDPEEFAKLAVALGRLGATAASVYTRAVLGEDGKPAQHLHLHGELATMTTEELRAYRERIRNDIAGRGTGQG